MVLRKILVTSKLDKSIILRIDKENHEELGRVLHITIDDKGTTRDTDIVLDNDSFVTYS